MPLAPKQNNVGNIVALPKAKTDDRLLFASYDLERMTEKAADASSDLEETVAELTIKVNDLNDRMDALVKVMGEMTEQIKLLNERLH